MIADLFSANSKSAISNPKSAMKLKYLLFVFCFFLIAPAARAESDLAKVESQLKKAEQENRQMETQVKKSDANVEQTKRDLVKTASQVEKLELERAAIRANISELDGQMARLSESIELNQGRLAEAAAGLLAMSGEPVFDTGDAREYVLASVLLSGISDGFDSEMRAAAEQVRQLEKIQAEKKFEQAKLDSTAKRYAEQRTDLDKLLRSRTAQNEKLKSQQYELQKRLRDLSARAKNLAELTAGISTGEVAADASFTAKKLRAPVSGRLVSTFGEKSGLGLVSDGWRIRARADAMVTAPADGRVEFSDVFKGYSRVLILSHKNSYYSVLTGLASSDVLVGQEVLAGEPVGRMPDSASEMYLELRRGNRAVDPARLFNPPD